MLSRSLLLVALTTLSSSAFGQTKAAPAAKPADPAATAPAEADKKEPEAAPAKEHYKSEDNRVGKMLSIVAEGGLAIAPFPQEGLGVGYFITPDFVTELSYVAGSTEFLGFTVTTSMAELRAKYFIGNSFYVIGGLGQRSIGIKAELDPAVSGGKKIDAKVSTNSTGLSFGIGNQWQWSGFTLGCQWLGYFAPMSSSGDTDVDTSGADSKDSKDLKDSIDSLAKTPSYQALRLYLGWTI